MPTFAEVLQGMQSHLVGTISGTVGFVATPETPLPNEAPPYVTVAPGDEGDGIHTQDDYRHPKAGRVLITTWIKPYDESEEEAVLRLLEASDLLAKRAVTATVGRHFSVPFIRAPQKVDNQDGILIYRTAEVTFYWRED